MTSEHVTISPDDMMRCVCGNEEYFMGFYPCTTDGEPSDDPESRFYACCRCGRVINTETLEVVGTRGEHTP